MSTNPNNQNQNETIEKKKGDNEMDHVDGICNKNI